MEIVIGFWHFKLSCLEAGSYAFLLSISNLILPHPPTPPKTKKKKKEKKREKDAKCILIWKLLEIFCRNLADN